MLAKGTQLGPYEIIAPLGAGGMGEIYQARDPRLGREVALKVLPDAISADPALLARFEQEARAASSLNHPNIVTIHDVGRMGPTSYIVMELIEGSSLRKLLDDGPLPLRRSVEIGAQVAEGLAAAHERSIVHRDLKPENVMIARSGVAKILDFGLAKLVVQPPVPEGTTVDLPSQPTQPGTILGTVGYMSPEQASGRPADFRSDQFSFGAILYEMTSGRRAFQRSTAVETLAAILKEEPDPLAAIDPTLPLPLVWVAKRCLAKDPEQRYASTRDLARDLRDLKDHLSSSSAGAVPAAEPSAADVDEVGLVRLWLGLLRSPRRWWEMDATGRFVLFFPLIVFLAWRVKEWTPGPWGLALFFGTVLCQALSLALRMSLLLVFVSFGQGALARQVWRLTPWIRGADLAQMGVFLLMAGMIWRDHAVTAGLLLLLCVGGLIGTLVLEPMMLAAAFPKWTPAEKDT